MDTPGFNDTHLRQDDPVPSRSDRLIPGYHSNVDVLRGIADWMQVSSVHLTGISSKYGHQTFSFHRYGRGHGLTGILYLHRISDNRMGSTSCKHLQMFQHLCGDDALENVVMVSTMWSQVDDAMGAQQEQQLLNSFDFWKGMIKKGSHSARYDGTQASVEMILDLLVNKSPMTTRLQVELVDEKKDLFHTTIGLFLCRELELQAEMLCKEIASLRSDMKMGQRQANVKATLREAKARSDATRKELVKLQHSRAEDRRRHEKATARWSGEEFWVALLKSVYDGVTLVTQIAQIVDDLISKV